jgi:Ca2+-binding RTX toxin-like protein
MNTHRKFGALGLGLAATATVGFGFATAQPALAARSGRAFVEADTLSVRGTSASEHMALRLAANSPNMLQVDFGDDGSADATFDRSSFSRIVVSLGAGDDVFRVDQVNGAFADETLIIDAGAGDDVVSGGDGAEIMLGRSGNDSFDGNKGADTAFLGAGADVFIWDPGDGSDAVTGDSGSDTLLFNGAAANETMSLSANGSQAVFLREPGAVRMDLDGVESVDVVALGGADAITVNDLTGTDVQNANIDLGVNGAGDASADTVTVNGTPRSDNVNVDADGATVVTEGLRAETRISGADSTDHLQVNTFEGEDEVNVSNAATTLMDIGFDLGADQS